MCDEELEKVMLYFIIFENADYVLDEEDFTTDRNKKIIKAINELKAEKQEISMLTVKAKIKANSSQVLSYLSTLSEYGYGTDAETAYNRLINLSKMRKLFAVIKKSEEEIKEIEDADTFAEKIIKSINNIQKINEKEKTFVEQVVEATKMIEDKVGEKEDYSLYTGMQDLDDILCGLHKQELTIIGARPRCWKDYICITSSD